MSNAACLYLLIPQPVVRTNPRAGHFPSAVIMLSPETLEDYRRMTPSERLRLTLEMIRAETPYLLRGTPEQVDRRFELLRRKTMSGTAACSPALPARETPNERPYPCAGRSPFQEQLLARRRPRKSTICLSGL